MEQESSSTIISAKAVSGAIAHQVFKVAVLAKGLNGVAEIFVSVLLFSFKKETVYDSFMALAGRAPAGISEHFATNYIIDQAGRFTDAQHFIGIYFLFYGIINVLLVVSLLQGKLWAYPVAIIATSIFILYLIYRFFVYRSGLLLFFTAVDIALVVLIWFEYRRISAKSADIVKN